MDYFKEGEGKTVFFMYVCKRSLYVVTGRECIGRTVCCLWIDCVVTGQTVMSLDRQWVTVTGQTVMSLDRLCCHVETCY